MRCLPILFALSLLLSAPLHAQTSASPDDGRDKELMAAFREVTLLEALAIKAEQDGRLEEAERALWQAVELIELKGGRQHPATLAKRSALARFYERNDRYADAERLLKQNIEVFEMTPAGDQRSLRAFDLADALAAFQERRKRFDDAEAALKWLTEPERAVPAPFETLVNNRFAILYTRWHRFADAVAYEQRVAADVADIGDKAKAGDQQSLNQAGAAGFAIMRLGALAEAYDLEGRPDLAEATYTRRVDLHDRYLGDPGAPLLEDLATFYSNRADHARAETVLKRMLASRKGNVSNTTLTLAGVYREAGRYREAEALIKDMLGFYEKMTPPPTWTIAEGQQRIAVLYALQGRHADAEPLLKRALEAIPADRQLATERAAWQKQHGDALKALGREAEAVSRYAEVEQTLKRALEESRNRDSAGRLAASLALARYYAEWGRHVEAVPLARDALALGEKRYGAEHRLTAAPLQTLADSLEASGDLAEARALAQRALTIGERTRGAAHPATQQSLAALARLDARLREQDSTPSKAN